MKAALQNYQARMRRVLDYIDRHLDSDLDLETVSGVAAFSKFHFHRQFYGNLRVIRASLCPACPYEARFAPAGLHGRPKRHGDSDGCRLRCTGRLRPRLSATVRAIAFVVPEVSRLGAVACGLRASRQREEQAHAEDFYR